MQDTKPSRTALATALMRAAHTRTDPEPLIDDPWGDRLVPASMRENLRQAMLERLDEPARAQALASKDFVDRVLMQSPAFANVIMRSRYTEDALLDAISCGIRQYVLVGAGFDSFALRRPAFAAGLEIFEIDHPATQTLKRECIGACGLTLPPTVHFIAADLSRTSVMQALANTAYRQDVPAFFSWLGVSMYLSREANVATFKSIAGCSPPGSRLAFTYMDERAFSLNSEAFQAIQRRVTALGEPFLSGFDPAMLADELRACGLRLLDDVDGAQAAARYDAEGRRRFDRHSASHMALASVVGAH